MLHALFFRRTVKDYLESDRLNGRGVKLLSQFVHKLARRIAELVDRRRRAVPA